MTKPPVIIGDKNFTEEYVLGSLHQEAPRAKGYKITLNRNIGSSEITHKAPQLGQIDMFPVQLGQIDMYPEYTGVILTAAHTFPATNGLL
jgi:osmoprotectant transport system substrate-binding protein